MLKRLNAHKGGLLYKMVFIAFSALIALSFALWGIGDMFVNSGRSVVIAEVGEVELRGEEFLRLYNQQTQTIQNVLGTAFDQTKARELGYVDSVLRDLIARALFDNEAKRMNLSISDQHTRDKIFYLEDFQDEAGRFSELIYRQLLREVGYNERNFVADFKRDLERRQLVASIGAGPRIATLMAEPLAAFRHEKRNARSILIEKDKMPKAQTPSAQTLKAWFNQRQDEFAAPQYYEVTYLALEPEDLKDEINVDEAEIRELYEERLYFFSKPARRKLLQILVDDERQARAIYDELREGQDFKKVAQAQAQLSEEDITLGWNTQAELLDELQEAVFAVEKGTISEPLRSPFGWHIFKIEDAEQAKTASFEEVRQNLLDELRFVRASEAIYNLFASVEDSLAGGANIEDAAQSIDLETNKLKAVSDEGKDDKGKEIETLPQPARFLKTVAASAPGETSDVLETETGGFFVLRLESVTPPRTRTFEEAKDNVLTAWLGEQQALKAQEQGERIKRNVKKGMAFATAAKGFNIVPFKSFTRSNFLDEEVPGEIAQELFEAKKGEVVAANLKEGYMVAILDDIEKADLTDDELLHEVQEGLISSLAQDLIRQYRLHLERLYPVTISDRAIDALLL